MVGPALGAGLCVGRSFTKESQGQGGGLAEEMVGLGNVGGEGHGMDWRWQMRGRQKKGSKR